MTTQDLKQSLTESHWFLTDDYLNEVIKACQEISDDQPVELDDVHEYIRDDLNSVL